MLNLLVFFWSEHLYTFCGRFYPNTNKYSLAAIYPLANDKSNIHQYTMIESSPTNLSVFHLMVVLTISSDFELLCKVLCRSARLELMESDIVDFWHSTWLVVHCLIFWYLRFSFFSLIDGIQSIKRINGIVILYSKKTIENIKTLVKYHHKIHFWRLFNKGRRVYDRLWYLNQIKVS